MGKRVRGPGAREVRLSGGEFRGRKIRSGPGIRPLTSMAREAMFSILGPTVIGAGFLDLFAGSGAIAFEAIGRGAEHATLVDAARSSVDLERRNARTLGIEDRVRILHGDVLRLLDAGRFDGRTFDLIFIGPPYDRDLCGPTLERIGGGILAEGGQAIVHASTRETLIDEYDGLKRDQIRRYGDVLLHFYGNSRA